MEQALELGLDAVKFFPAEPAGGLKTNQAITDVYHQYGFSDYTSFYRAFKKEYGISPKEYKELHRSVEEL